MIASCALPATLLIALAAAAAVSPGQPVPDFTLRDAYDVDFQLSGHADSTIVLICADREGSNWSSTWGRAARAAGDSAAAAAGTPGPRMKIRFIADLRGVPGFMHGYVRGKFKPKNPSSGHVLLDWDGTMAKIFGLTPHVANVFVIGPGSKLSYATAGEGRPEELEKLRVAIIHALEPAPGTRP